MILALILLVLYSMCGRKQASTTKQGLSYSYLLTDLYKTCQLPVHNQVRHSVHSLRPTGRFCRFSGLQ